MSHLLHQAIIKEKLRNYCSVANMIGKIPNERDAIRVLIEMIIQKTTAGPMFQHRGPEKDDRYFVFEVQGTRVMTAYMNTNGELDVDILEGVSDNTYPALYFVLEHAISAQIMDFHIESLDRVNGPLLKAISNFGS